MNDYAGEELYGLMARDQWAGGTVLRGELPQVPQVDALPTAGEQWAYRMVTLPGDGATTADVTYQCLRTSAGVWGWRTMATG